MLYLNKNMRKIFKNTIFLLPIVILMFFIKTEIIRAETSFGGQKLITINCTCSGANTMLYIYDYKTSTLLTLLYSFGNSRLYETYNLYGQYFLGTYTTATDQCLIYAGTSCVSLNANYQIGNLPGSGTSN
jgi:hypothetical protein